MLLTRMYIPRHASFQPQSLRSIRCSTRQLHCSQFAGFGGRSFAGAVEIRVQLGFGRAGACVEKRRT